MLSFAVKSNSAVLNPKSETQIRNNIKIQMFKIPNIKNTIRLGKSFFFWDIGILVIGICFGPPWRDVVGTHCGRYNSGRRM
jgi:hypothetical protein